MHLTPLAARSVTPALPPDLTVTETPIAPVRKREPYAVERYPALDGSVLLIGYDGRGDVMIEVRIPARKCSEDIAARMKRWLMRHDDKPTIRLVPT